jgi:gamma-tubulin complex component 3
MIHFAQEMSHYLSFEVVACAWEQLSVALRNSKTMDQLLTAHEHFLQTVTSRALLDEESRVTLIEFLIIRYNNELCYYFRI